MTRQHLQRENVELFSACREASSSYSISEIAFKGRTDIPDTGPDNIRRNPRPHIHCKHLYTVGIKWGVRKLGEGDTSKQIQSQ